MTINRRRFLFGMGAIAAAAALPPVAQFEQIVAAPPATAFLKRLITDITFSTMGADSSGARSGLLLDLKRPGTNETIFHTGISNSGALWRWVAMRGNEIIVLPESLVDFDIRGDMRKCEVHLICHDTVDEGPPIELQESHFFEDGSHTNVMSNFLYPDNSLQARLERKRSLRTEEDDDEPKEEPKYVPSSFWRLPWRS